MNFQKVINVFNEVKDQIGVNPRLRFGLIVIGALFLTWISLVLSEFNLDQYSKVRKLGNEITMLSEIESSDVWQQRLNETRSVLAEAQGNLWASTSEALAIAMLQARVRNLHLSTGISSDIKVDVGTPQKLEKLAGVKKVRLRVAVAQLSSDQLLEVLTHLQASRSRLVVEELNVRRLQTGWTYELLVSAYITTATANTTTSDSLAYGRQNGDGRQG